MFWSSKKAEPVKSGFMGDTSPEQDQVLAEFKAWIQSQDIDLTKYRWDDYDLLRFCRARKFKMDDMQLMFNNCLQWREAEGVDTIIDDFQYTERAQVQQLYPHGYHGTDKLGRPVYIERFGELTVDKLFEVTTEDRIVRHFIQEYEILMKLRFPACSAVAGKRIEQGLTIIDMSGNGSSALNSQTRRLFQLASKVGSDYYPEIMGNLFVTNAPFTFSAIWAVCKGFLDEKTRNKIKILGGSFKSELNKYLDDKDIPSFLGGQSPCDKFEDLKDMGPWNDYMITADGIAKKEGATVTEVPQEEETKQD